jgi:hypothetical protein
VELNLLRLENDTLRRGLASLESSVIAAECRSVVDTPLANEIVALQSISSGVKAAKQDLIEHDQSKQDQAAELQYLRSLLQRAKAERAGFDAARAAVEAKLAASRAQCAVSCLVVIYFMKNTFSIGVAATSHRAYRKSTCSKAQHCSVTKGVVLMNLYICM